MSKEDLITENEKLRGMVAVLEQQLAWFKRQIFGKRSEKIVETPSNQPFLPGFQFPPKNEQNEQVETRVVPQHTRRKPNRQGQDKIVLPDDLPVKREVIDLPEEEKICAETGAPLVKIGEEVSHKLAFKPGSYYIKEIVRPKYAVANNPDAGILIASLPDSLLSRCQADEGFLADMLVKKFADYLPLYRQSEMLSRDGIFISRQILCQWTVRAATALAPLRDLMMQEILKSENVFIDEVPIDMLSPGKGTTQAAYMWILAGGKSRDPPYRVYDFFKDRKHINARVLLDGYHGVLHSDKFGAYEALANAKQFTWAPCWSHIRRKFFEAETGDPEFRRWVLRKIKYLFMLERIAWERDQEERLRIRQEKEVPIIDELSEAIKSKLISGRVLPKSKLKEALGYFLGLIPYLKNYTSFPFARLDNNVAERAARPIAIGRKNWLFVGNEAGGDAAAIACSLIQTCRALDINPREYLEDVMRRIMSHPANKLSQLLPDRWAESRTPSD
jgi:transposase